MFKITSLLLVVNLAAAQNQNWNWNQFQNFGNTNNFNPYSFAPAANTFSGFPGFNVPAAASQEATVTTENSAATDVTITTLPTPPPGSPQLPANFQFNFTQFPGFEHFQYQPLQGFFPIAPYPTVKFQNLVPSGFNYDWLNPKPPAPTAVVNDVAAKESQSLEAPVIQGEEVVIELEPLDKNEVAEIINDDLEEFDENAAVVVSLSSQLSKMPPRKAAVQPPRLAKSEELFPEITPSDIKPIKATPEAFEDTIAISAEDELRIPEEAIVEESELEVQEDHPCYAPVKRGRLACSGVEAENSGLRWYYSKTDFRCYTLIYTGCGGNNNNYASREECEDKCYVADGPSCAPGGKTFEGTGDNCEVLECSEGSVCRMGAFFASCCDKMAEKYSEELYADMCPDGGKAHSQLVSKSCLDLVCPDGHACAQINPFYAKCCSTTAEEIPLKPTPTNAPPLPPNEEKEPECSKPDRHPYCNYWALVGECPRNSNFMHFYCKRACNLCPGFPTTSNKQ